MEESAPGRYISIKIELEEKPGKFLALSGLTYSYKNDWFITTISSENAGNITDDAAFGDSYLGIVENATRKIGRKRFKINEYFNLSDLDKKFKGQKIESVCIQADKDHRLKLHMVSTNNKGENSLFKVRLKEEEE